MKAYDLWNELWGDLGSTVVLWQLAIIAFSLLLAWGINNLLRRTVTKKAPEAWKIGVGGINRVLFPLLGLAFVFIGKLILHHWQHTSLLALAATLLVAMACIRLTVYTLRYIFMPSGWLHTMESAISTVVWIVVALHFTGLLPEVLNVLEGISFSAGKLHISLLLILQVALTGVVTLVITLWISRFAENKMMHAEQVSMNLRVVLSKLIRVSLLLVGVLTALSVVGFDITLLSVFGGALGVGLGFGLQKIASNYVSGFIILLDESLHLGDVITVDGHYGVVNQLRSRYLVLRKLDGTEVVIPNESLISSAVINHSFSDRKARVLVPVQVSYESPLEKAMSIMLAAAKKHPRVLVDPASEVQVLGFGENGIDLQLSIWIIDPEEGSSGLKSQIYLDIWWAFQEQGIAIPYPQRDIRILNSNQSNLA